MDAVAIFDPVSSAEPLKKEAHDQGFKVIGVFTQPLSFFQEYYHLDKAALSAGCDEVIFAEQAAEILKQLRASKFKVKAAIAGVDNSVELAEEIAEKLNLYSNPTELTLARRDKGEMRQVLKASGLTCPDFALCSSKEEIMAFANAHRYPLVVKTPKGAMTSQVYICENSQTLLAAFHSIYNSKDIYGNFCARVVIEEYLGGKEYVVNTFSDGKQVHVSDVWVYDKVDTEHYKNVYYNILSLWPIDPAIRAIVKYAIRVAEVFKIERGMAHIELKDDPVKGPVLIEIGARLAGARMPVLVRKYTNFDPYKATIEVFTQGKTKVPDPVTYKRHFAIVFCPLFQGGRVKKISGIPEIKKLPSYDFHVLNLHEGEVVEPSTHLGTMRCLVFLAHEKDAQLMSDVERAHELFTIDFS